MECRDAQFYLRLRRHAGDEFDADATAELGRHLATCSACAHDARVADSFNAAVGNALRRVPVPDGLREKLLNHAAAYRGGVIRRKMLQGATVAATLFVGVGLALGIFSFTRPKIDPVALAMASDNLVQDREGQSLKQWLTGQGFPEQLPYDFDPALLVSMGTEEIQGKNVPVLVFRGRIPPGFPREVSEFAKVYLFKTDGRFNLDAVREMNSATTSTTRALVVDDPQRFRGVKYVIVHTGRTLEPFLIQQAGNPVGDVATL